MNSYSLDATGERELYPGYFGKVNHTDNYDTGLLEG